MSWAHMASEGLLASFIPCSTGICTSASSARLLTIPYLHLLKPPTYIDILLPSAMSADTQSAPLRNEYWLLRHGRSLANEAEIIVSALDNGVLPKWSLAAAGEEQALVAGQRLQEVLASHPSRPLLCYSSPFSRAQRTAELALSKLELPQAPPIQGALELRERYFGDTLELQSYAAAYGHVWEGDAQSADHQPGGDGESVAMVGKRIRALFQALEDAHEGAIILLVSHGDTLSILEATMRGADTRQHRGYAFENAELRRLEA